MSRATNSRHLRSAVVACVLLALSLGCSSDSPTAPQQQPPGAPPAPSAQWTITISVDSREVVAGSPDPAIVTVRVRRASDNSSPPSGTTIVLSTSLGEFVSAGSELTSVVLGLISGRAEVLYFPGTITGNAVLTAQLEGSVGQKTLPIVPEIEPVVASFTFANSFDNFVVSFANTSTGDPTSFRWSFGDGSTSREENPTHRFPGGGDYVVQLTASKTGSSDTASQIVTVNEDEIVADFEVRIDGRTVQFQDTSEGEPTSWRWDFGDGTGSTQQNPLHTYRRDGAYVVTLTASKRGFSDSTSAFVEILLEPFIQLINPNTGPPSGGTVVTITGVGFVNPARVFFGGRLAQVLSLTPTQIRVSTPAVVLPTEECDSDDDGTPDGIRTLNLTVNVQVEVGNPLQTLAPIVGGFTYVSPTGDTCVP